MKFFKAIGFITLWILLSFIWVRFGFAQTRGCPADIQMQTWLKSNATLENWYDFYRAREGCGMSFGEFLKTLAGSEQLSIRLNQAEVAFDQFYVPINDLLTVDWNKIDGEGAQRIQSDLSLINSSLRRGISTISNAGDQDYFRAVVLLNMPTEFVETTPQGSPKAVTKRLNKETGRAPPVIDSRDVTPPPYEKVFTPPTKSDIKKIKKQK